MRMKSAQDIGRELEGNDASFIWRFSPVLVYRKNIIVYFNNRVDVRGHKYVFGPTQNHFSPSVARVEMSSEEGQKHIYVEEHQLYYYYDNFKGHIFEQKLKISLKSGHLK